MTASVKCPECGTTATGKFCSACGTPLGGRFCNQCGAKATAGATFCNECGARLGSKVAAPRGAEPTGSQPGRTASSAPGRGRAGTGRATPPRTAPASEPAPSTSNAVWWAGGAIMVVVTLFMAVPLLTGGEEAPTPTAPFASGGGAGAGPGAVDLSSMTPRQAADRLFDRVMRAASANNDAEVSMFLPMAIQAYDMLGTKDADAYYHQSLLQLTGTNNEAALEAARQGLELHEDHLLNLYAAGSAALALEDTALARQYLERLLAVYDQEMASGNLDYEAHAAQMGTIREFAEENTAG